jgi:hypothetical protein
MAVQDSRIRLLNSKDGDVLAQLIIVRPLLFGPHSPEQSRDASHSSLSCHLGQSSLLSQTASASKLHRCGLQIQNGGQTRATKKAIRRCVVGECGIVS